MTLTKEDLKSEHEFQGAWITDKTIPYDKKKSPVPLSVRRTFSLAKKLRRAVLYATAVGNYYVTVNGAKITDEMLAPGYTSYEKYGLLSASGYVKPYYDAAGALVAVQSASVQNVIIFCFLGLDVLACLAAAGMLSFLRVEKDIGQKQAEIKARAAR